MPDDPHLTVLHRLNEIGKAINALNPETTGRADIEAALRLIVESAAAVVPGSSAVIYTYDRKRGVFEQESRVSAEDAAPAHPDDYPRPEGFGRLALTERRRVLSYEEPQIPIHPSKQAAGARVMICCPLLVRQEVEGVLYLYLHETRTLTSLELAALDTFVNQAAMALYVARQRSRAETREAQKDNELRHLRRASLLISTRSNLQETLETILEMALGVMDARFGIFRLVDGSGDNLVTRAFVGEDLQEPALEALPIDKRSIMGRVALERRPIIASDLREPPFREIYYPLDPKYEMRSEVAVPLIGARGRLEGVLNLESPFPNAFSKQDLYILQILASQAVVAIQEMRLLDALQDISTQMLTQSPRSALGQIVTHTRDLLNVAACMLWLQEGENLVLQAATDPEDLKGETRGPDGLLGAILRSAEPAAVYELSKDPRVRERDLAAARGWGSALLTPVMATDAGDPVGVISIYTASDDLRHFEAEEWERKVLNLMGHYASLAIQNAAQLEDLRQAQEKQAVAETFAAVGDIAANLLHRLNNKIGAIPVRVEGIAAKARPEIEGSPYLQANLAQIEASALDAMEIVRESLFHLRPIQLAPVSVALSVREALQDVELAPGIELYCTGLEALPPVTADHKRLTFVFANLVENAGEAMAGEGRIHIDGHVENEWVIITVRDDGPGIPPGLHDRIFEFTYSARTRTHPGKLGFGLWWVKTMMTRFGGAVALEAAGPRGAAFRLQLPNAGGPE